MEETQKKNKCNFFHSWKKIGHYGEVIIMQCDRCKAEKEETISERVIREQNLEYLKDKFLNDLEK